MIVHVVLLEPRPDLTPAARADALTALARAAASMPDIRQFRIGRRVTHGLPGYEQQMEHDYEYALLLEFEDVAALGRYLRAPAHGTLGSLFTTASRHALAYDYEIADVSDAARLLT
jgi:hypothetical protein